MSDDDLTDDRSDELPPSAAEPSDDSAVNTKQRRSKESRIDREAREAEVFWAGVFSTVVGRREMWRLLAGGGGSHAFETQFPAGAVGFPDPNAAWYARGEQDFGLRLYHRWIKLDPLAVSQMHIENDHRFAKKPRRN